MINTTALQRTLEHIKENPEGWDQRLWSRCFAGWTIRLEHPDVVELEERCCASHRPGRLVKDGRILNEAEIESWAAEILGLTASESDDLFADGTLDDLEYMVSELIAEAGAEVST